MTTSTIDAPALTVVLPADFLEVSCSCEDGRVATHELLGPVECHHFFCLEHTDMHKRLVESLLRRRATQGPQMWECSRHNRIFRSDCAQWRFVPIGRDR